MKPNLLGIIRCKDCDILIDSTNYVNNSFGIRSKCRICFNLEKRMGQSYSSLPKEQKEKYENRRRKNKYGITGEDYNKLLKLQLEVCAICKQKCSSGDNLCVDHNHETGKIRGLLCRKCNLAVNLVQENEDTVWALMDYIKNDGIIIQKDWSDFPTLSEIEK